MKQKKLRFIKCECDREISARTLARHLRSAINLHSKEFVDRCVSLIELAKNNRQAWEIAKGVDGKGDPYWCVRILNGELSLEEISFQCPRPRGRGTPEALKKISKDRKGKGNPSLLNKVTYDIDELKAPTTAFFENLIGDPKKFNKTNEYLDLTFPDYRYSFAGIFPEHYGKRGHNRRNIILSFLIGRSIDWIVSEKAADRGKFIKEGQRKSDKFNVIQNAGRTGLRGHVTIPHRTLYNMILSVDKYAKMEKQIDYKETWKSYDIVSPTMKILVEMHGRVWHDLSVCKSNLVPLVTENVENDKIKEKLAEDNGYKLYVFWDDQCDIWEAKVEEIYGKQPKKYEQALREELDKKAKRRSL